MWTVLLGVSGCQHTPTTLGPDGHPNALAYKLNGGAILVINDNGTGKRLLWGGSTPKWSPDGDRIAFYGTDYGPGAFLCTIGSDGTDFRKLTLAVPDGELLTEVLDWSPDGKQLVFYTTKYHYSGFAVINADGSNEINLTPEGFWRQVRWSPDGSKIALEGAPAQAQPSIYIINPDGTGMYNLVDTFAVDPLWRFDGKKIAFSIGTRQDTTQFFRFDHYMSDVDGLNLVRLTDDGNTYVDSWSPDGGKMLYLFRPQGIINPLSSGIGVMNADGSQKRELLQGGENHAFILPSFSLDGRKIAYVRNSNTGAEDVSSLWVMNADGSNQRKLDGHMEPTVIFYDWSPK
jgi:TolB protein